VNLVGRAGYRWIDQILRYADGSPSLKPPGNLGLLTCLLLSGTLSKWVERGIEILAIASGDDVGFRLDPALLGLFGDPTIDAVVVGVPWGVRGTVAGHGTEWRVRGEVSGECLAETGQSGQLQAAPGSASRWRVTFEDCEYELGSSKLDRGGAICELPAGKGWRVGVAEAVAPTDFDVWPLYSTNQMYLRVSALLRTIGTSTDEASAEALEPFLAAQPFYAERKAVDLNGVTEQALQISQGFNDILRQMKVRPVLGSRFGDPVGRGGFAPLKGPEDIRFAQHLLDSFARRGDDLCVDQLSARSEAGGG
jgi:hypothetical protein